MAAEIIVDSFAGGGGTSEGIRMALGRDPDIAINHDALALAMHRLNHPGTKHMVEDVWSIDARAMCNNAPIGLLWMSPDCKHFSKAKGGKPREKAIRGLAWVGVRWVKSLPKRQRPRVIILENVEEFQDWGPLLEGGKPCPIQKGVTFKAYIGAYRSMGYKAQWWELRACDYGDPTIRRRLFVVMRRDGKPIVKPPRTHGNPKDPADAALIAAGQIKPWRTASEIINWSLPCPSIFETSAEIKDRWGLRAVRPLKPATLARIAKGTKRYVIDAAEPFIVPITHAGDLRVHGVDEPLRTITTAKRGEHALLTPFVTKFNRGATGHAVDEPLATVTSHASETHGGGAAPLGVVAPHLVRTAHGEEGQNGARRWGAGEHDVGSPLPTVTTSKDVALVAAHLSRQFGESIGQPADEPAPTVMASGQGKTQLVAAHLSVMRNAQKPFSAMNEPTHTVTAGGATPAMVAAFLAQHNAGPRAMEAGRPADEPISTITVAGSQQGVIAASFISHAYTSNTGGGQGDPQQPLRTELAGGNHAATVYAFLSKYYGEGLPSQAVTEPLHSITTKPRHGLVTVLICGEPYVIIDIGMRMLTPRERFSAQGFGAGYVIDRGMFEDGSIINLTLEQQGRMCGNSVCPGMARALVVSNYDPLDDVEIPQMADAPLLTAAE